jgi:hypothetical protein
VTDFALLGISDDEADRAHAAIRRLVKECLDVTRDRLRRGERPNLGAVARGCDRGPLSRELTKKRRPHDGGTSGGRAIEGYETMAND